MVEMWYLLHTFFQIEENHSPTDLTRPSSGGSVNNSAAEATKKNQMQVSNIVYHNLG